MILFPKIEEILRKFSEILGKYRILHENLGGLKGYYTKMNKHYPFVLSPRPPTTMQTSLLLLLALSAAMFLSADAKFSFALPGNWGSGSKRSFSFALPGKWGNVKRDGKVDCSDVNDGSMYYIAQAIQVRGYKYKGGGINKGNTEEAV